MYMRAENQGTSKIIHLGTVIGTGHNSGRPSFDPKRFRSVTGTSRKVLLENLRLLELYRFKDRRTIIKEQDLPGGRNKECCIKIRLKSIGTFKNCRYGYGYGNEKAKGRVEMVHSY